MSELIHTPLFLSLFFPILTVLGTAPLLRWALSGEYQHTYASLSLGLACLIALICAYGRLDGGVAFGPTALPYGVGGSSLLSLIYCRYVQNTYARLVFCALTTLIWCWLLVGGPLNEAAMVSVLRSFVGLCLVSFVFVFRNRFEGEQGHVPSVFISLGVATFTLGLIALKSDMSAAFYFSQSLCAISLSALFLSYPRFGFSFQENGLYVLSLSCAGIAWILWTYADVPVIALLCVGMIFFARPATKRLIENSPAWLSKAYYVFLSLFCMLPAFLSLLFYDVLGKL